VDRGKASTQIDPGQQILNERLVAVNEVARSPACPQGQVGFPGERRRGTVHCTVSNRSFTRGLFMSEETQAILTAALALPEADRAELAERLLESLSPEMDELSDDELFAELERRRAEAEKDPSVAIPWTDVVKDV
jgi:putative addiction module component (TIGR02574 family)